MKKLLILLLCSTATFFAFVNDDEILKKIIDQLDKYNLEYPQEKAYLHTDKPYYIAGETIWFKSYLVEGMTNHPDTVSVPLYVELVDNQAGRLIEKRTIKLDHGFGYGDFRLSDTLRSGYYQLRAYTNWMLNFGDDMVFTKDFKVYSTKDQAPPTLSAKDIDFQMFPEGGNLVEGLDGRVGFKATDAAGKGIDISGEILTEEGDTVVSINSENLGMGFFRFKPEVGKKYQAVVRYQSIYTKRIDLPIAQKEGYTLTVDNTSNKTLIKVYVANNIQKPNTKMILIGQSRGVVLYAGQTPVGKKSAYISIPREKFAAGVVQFTLFDENLKPRCERVAFIEPTKSLNFNITTHKQSYRTREKVNLDIEVKDNEGKPVEGNFSLSVLDQKQVVEAPFDENILTNLLLSSDVKGKIESPAYYFDKTNKNAAYHLDILMMTQGWRRFTWDKVMQETLPKPTYFLEQGLTISGEVVRQNDKAFEKTVALTMMITGADSTRQFLMGEANKDGSFIFYGLDFKDSCDVLVQAVAGKNNRNTKIIFAKPNTPKFRIVKIPYGVVEIDASELSEYLKRTRDALELEKKLLFEKAIMLGEVLVKAKKRENERDTRVLYGRADASINVENTYGAVSIFDLIRGRVAGVQVSGDPMNPSIQIRGISSISLSTEPLFLLDGVPVTKETLLSVNVFDVEKIDVLKSAATTSMYGSQGANGVISVLTKRGNKNYDWSKDEAMGIKSQPFLGYYTAKEFYMPKYDQDLPENVRPDYRSTVFWSPIIKTDKDGKAKVSFFNTDAETTMRVHIEGIAYGGVMGSGKANFSVKK
ncbi:MAG: TonB-dependent receptor plug domain-containing protein [Spirosomataceae bacterium]